MAFDFWDPKYYTYDVRKPPQVIERIMANGDSALEDFRNAVKAALPAVEDPMIDTQGFRRSISPRFPQSTHCEYCGTKTFPEDRCCVACGAPA